MRIVCAACRRCTGRFAARWPIAKDVFEIESASATDNPLVFAETGDVLSGGNFHGAPLALALDYAAIALTDLMSISERRTDRLVNPDLNEGLPPFLAPHAGNAFRFYDSRTSPPSSLLNEAKVLAHPASVDNLPTSGGKEDHVSMGMTGGAEAADDCGKRGAPDGDRVSRRRRRLWSFGGRLKGGAGVERAYERVRVHFACGGRGSLPVGRHRARG